MDGSKEYRQRERERKKETERETERERQVKGGVNEREERYEI